MKSLQTSVIAILFVLMLITTGHAAVAVRRSVSADKFCVVQIGSDPDDLAIMTSSGFLAHRKQIDAEYKKAKKDYQEALRLNPDFTEARTALERLQARQ